MSRRSGTRIKPERKPIVMIAGEGSSDRKSLRVILEHLCPDMRQRIVEIDDRFPLRSATGVNLAHRVDRLSRLVKARAKKEDADVACVFVHEDLDRPYSQIWDQTQARVQAQLAKVLGPVHYVLAVHEVEAWLLLFPDALTSFVSTWSVPARYRGCDTGAVLNPKEVLMRECTREPRRYRAADAPDVFAQAVHVGILDRPTGTNRSWSQLLDDVAECGQVHLPSPREGQ